MIFIRYNVFVLGEMGPNRCTNLSLELTFALFRSGVRGERVKQLVKIITITIQYAPVARFTDKVTLVDCIGIRFRRNRVFSE